ncbi:MAG: hypothetical protein ACLQSR_16190 [Limisphaerales bacterium]
MVAPAIDRRRVGTLFLQPDGLLAVALTLLVVCLHLYFLLHAGGLSRDEVNLLNLSGRHSFAEMERDSFPTLMPVLVRVWSAVGLGQSDFALRIFGMLVGLGTPAVLWLAAWKIRRAPPLAGLVLLALNAIFITYGDSLRAYGIGSLTILLAATTAGLLLKNPTWPKMAVFTLFSILSVQALYQNAVFVAAICFGAWAVCLREKKGRAALKILLAAVIASSSLLPYLSQIASLPDAAKSLRSGFDLQLFRINLDNSLGFPLEQYVWIWAFFALVVLVCPLVAFCCHGKSVSIRDSPMVKRTVLAVAVATAFGLTWFIAAPAAHWIFLPVLTLALVYLDSGHWLKQASAETRVGVGPMPGESFSLFAGVTLLTGVAMFYGFLWYAAMPAESWYFLPLMALAAACIEMGLPRGLHLRAAIFGFAVLTVLMAVPPLRANLNWRFTNIDLIVRELTAKAQPGDFIVVSPWYDGITFAHYYTGNTPWNTLPPLADHSVHRYDLVRAQMEQPDALQPVLGQISSALQNGHRVWILGRMGPPQSGVTLPAPLPMPPLKYTGWADRPYDVAWENQMMQFLAGHSRNFHLVYESTGLNINDTERLILYSADGWTGALPGNSR